ncbi:hypothetical protein ACW9HC_27535 [Nocardia gipuzkoensis]
MERFGAAAAQLGATDVAVRIARVYAMAGAADESDGLRRQQCIDVLCGYLRLPYSPELGANHQSKLVLEHHRATADRTHADDEERHFTEQIRQARAILTRPEETVCSVTRLIGVSRSTIDKYPPEFGQAPRPRLETPV